ncbi:phosphatidylserine decarboxylase-like protein [Mycena vulgaris]|nr:phosphatidylserine decarboxylase-like protein [Mycena vulgaris]
MHSSIRGSDPLGLVPLPFCSWEYAPDRLAAEVTHPTHRTTFVVLPEIESLKTFIESDSQIYMGFNSVFKGSPLSKHLDSLPRHVTCDHEQTAPGSAILRGNWTAHVDALSHAMNTHGGFNAFLNKELNGHFKCMLDNEDEAGWLSKPFLIALTANFDGLPFEDIFVCDPAAKYYGFTSWDDFLSRRLRPGVRSVKFAENPDIIGAACESQVYNPVLDMLNHDELAPQFVEVTVCQGFLSVTAYHRWHSPTAGVLRKIVTFPGAYFCQSPATLQQPNNTNPYFRSLVFLTVVSTRLLIFIEADKPRIGLFCFIAIDMAEVYGGADGG